MTVHTATTTYRNSAKHPIRYGTLHPGSYFRIVAEPERGVFKSKDMAIYRRSRDGFYSENVHNGQQAVLYPTAIVQPLVKERQR